ncbi:NAD(P)/FAD-dependent oxidoreductase [Lentibacillus cibarius]|nr:FAD-binding oxidoreductase [Lentibacillus cibarius]
MHINSYWAHSRNEQKQRNILHGEKHTDVAIVGGGFTGLSTAYHLQELGYHTTVLEQNNVGWGASGRNGSLMLVGYKKSLVDIAKKFGIDTAQEMLQLSLDGIETVKAITQKHDISCELTNAGSFCAAYKPSHLENLKREQEFMMEKLNYENYIVETDDVRSEINSPLYCGGMVDPNSHYFHPLNYAIGLADAVEETGGVIYEQTPVTAISHTNDRSVLSTPGGRITAKHVVVATNGYSTDLTKRLSKTIIPMSSHMLATEPLREETASELIPNRRGIFDTKNILYYFRMSADHRLLFGGRIQGEESSTLYSKLRQCMLEVFPQLENARIDYTWGGLTAVTMDFFPRIGQMQDGTYFATGYTGHGVSLSTLMGKMIAHNIDQSNYGKSILERLPLKRIPLHSQHALILNVATNYFRFKDQIS